MKKVRILHCADLHFDTPFKELTKGFSHRCKRELLEVFKNIIDLAISEGVEIMLIAGDVFDNLTVNKETLLFIVEQLERIKHINVFIAPGNHDPYNNKSFYNIINWPKNVHVFKNSMENVEIKSLDTVIWGAAFNNNYEENTLLREIVIDKSKINIMVLHGDLSNNNSVNKYNPIYINDIEKSNVDYIALGHRHNFSGITRAGATFYAYSGCPQGRGFDEVGPKGVIIGDVYKGGNSLEFMTTSIREYIIKEINVTGIKNYDELIEKIISLCGEKRKSFFYKVILSGQLPEYFPLKEDILLSKLEKEFYYIKIINNTSIEIDFEELTQDYSIKSKFICRMLELLENSDEDEKEIINLAIKVGIQCLTQDEVNLNDN